MRLKGIIEVTGIASACFVVALTTASCDSRRDGEQVALANVEESAKESKKELSRAEMFEADFRRAMDSTNSTANRAFLNNMAVCKILDEVVKLSNDEAAPILERFLDTATTTSLEPITDFPSKYEDARRIYWAREGWFKKRFSVIRDTFYTYMKVKEDPFEDWDRLFAFFEMCTNEFTIVSRCQPKFDGPKREYLLEFKDNYFKTFVHVVRDIDLKHHKTKPTEKQRAEIFRRFEELEKYVETLVPPRKTGAEKQKILNRNDTPIVPAKKEEFDAKRFNPKLVM